MIYRPGVEQGMWRIKTGTVGAI